MQHVRLVILDYQAPHLADIVVDPGEADVDEHDLAIKSRRDRRIRVCVADDDALDSEILEHLMHLRLERLITLRQAPVPQRALDIRYDSAVQSFRAAGA